MAQNNEVSTCYLIADIHETAVPVKRQIQTVEGIVNWFTGRKKLKTCHYIVKVSAKFLICALCEKKKKLPMKWSFEGEAAASVKT